MGNTSDKSKQVRNTFRYTQLKISVNPDVAVAFREVCAAENASVASRLSGFMADCCGYGTKPNPADKTATRPKRRIATERLIRQLELIKEAEERYMDNIPDNLRGSAVYEKAELTVSALDEAIELLTSAY